MLSGLKRALENVPFYVFLIPLIPYLRWYLDLRLQMELADFLVSMGVVAAGILTVLLVLRLALRNWHKAALATAFLTAAIIYLPMLIPVAGPAPKAALLSAGALLVVFLWFISVMLRSKSPHRASTIILNVILAAVLIPDLYRVISWEMEVRPDRQNISAMFEDVDPAIGGADGPDVWHIVFDRYAGAETLKNVYAFDNTPFLASLEKRGFSVAHNAHANYHQTPLSLLSTFSFDYLDGLVDKAHLRRDDWVPIYKSLADNRVMRLFKAKGYRLYQAGTWWEPTRNSPNADVSINYRSMPEFARIVLQQSLLGPLIAASGAQIGDGRSDQCGRVPYQFQQLRDVAASPERKFVFAHMLIPHPPFVFDADGRCKEPGEVEAASRATNYTDQVRYANSQATELIDAILKGPRPAIVILQADEGPWPKRFAVNEVFGSRDRYTPEKLDFTPEELGEKMRVLYAVRTPDAGKIVLADQETPINLYRRLLNTFFGYDFDYLEDRSYVAEFRSDHYRYHDVTGDLTR